MYDTLYSIIEQCIQRDNGIKNKEDFMQGVNFKDNEKIISVYELGLIKAEQLAQKFGIKTVSDLTSYSFDELLILPEMGVKSII